MLLEDLKQVFGGRTREISDRRWLDTSVGGLRTFIICRITNGGGVTFDLAVFTPHTRELDPFCAREEGREWCLDGGRVVPRLRDGFLFIGCPRGILFASNTSDPSLDSIVATLWDLAAWARKPWRPAGFSAESIAFWARERARARRSRWIRLAWVLVVVAVVLWLRADVMPLLSSMLAALAKHSAIDEEAVA
jgi:hypothetical protein